MKVKVVYKEDSEHARAVSDFLRDFEYQTGHVLETLNPETPDGTSFCDTYDIIEYPTVIALSDDGVMQNLWRGVPLPTISEVSYYVG